MSDSESESSFLRIEFVDGSSSTNVPRMSMIPPAIWGCSAVLGLDKANSSKSKPRSSPYNRSRVGGLEPNSSRGDGSGES